MATQVIQLHKADDPVEQWMPKTYASAVNLDKWDDINWQSGHRSFYPSGINSNTTVDEALVAMRNSLEGKQSNLGIDSQGGDETLFLNQKGEWAVPAGGGGSGSGTVKPSTVGRLAYYTENTAVSGCNLNWDAQNGRLGVDKDSPTVALDVDGNIYASGGITCAASSSDRRLKTDIKPFNGLDIINNMDYVQFKWNNKVDGLDGNDKFFDKSSINYGVIAQDVEGVIDGLVFDMPNGYKGVRYEKLIPIMAQAIKELSEKVDYLQSLIKQR